MGSRHMMAGLAAALAVCAALAGPADAAAFDALFDGRRFASGGFGGGTDGVPELGRSGAVREVPASQDADSGAAILPPYLRPKDAFGADEECFIVDARFFQAVSLESAVAALRPCMRALSARYGVKVTAERGMVKDGVERPGIRILVAGPVPPGNTVLLDLRHSLRLRYGVVVTHPAEVALQSPETAEDGAGMTRAELDAAVRARVPFPRELNEQMEQSRRELRDSLRRIRKY